MNIPKVIGYFVKAYLGTLILYHRYILYPHSIDSLVTHAAHHINCQWLNTSIWVVFLPVFRLDLGRK